MSRYAEDPVYAIRANDEIRFQDRTILKYDFTLSAVAAGYAR
jgi:hypothetical protein